MKFERSKLIMFNHRPDDREFLYFLKFHPIYHYNVHESDLEVSGVQFGLKRFIRQPICVTNRVMDDYGYLSPGSDSFSILVNISYADCDFCFGRLYPK